MSPSRSNCTNSEPRCVRSPSSPTTTPVDRLGCSLTSARSNSPSGRTTVLDPLLAPLSRLLRPPPRLRFDRPLRIHHRLIRIASFFHIVSVPRMRSFFVLLWWTTLLAFVSWLLSLSVRTPSYRLCLLIYPRTRHTCRTFHTRTSSRSTTFRHVDCSLSSREALKAYLA